MRLTVPIVIAGSLIAALTVPAASADQPAATAPGVTVTPAERIAKLTGPDSINATDTKWAVKAADLGILWDNGSGQVLTALGDTFGAGWTGPGGGVGDPATIDWRCNVLLRSADHDLADGITFDSAAEDRPGHAKQLLDCKQINQDEITVIPTAAISVGNRQYIHYMSVNNWGPPGVWYTNYSGIAYSDDNGQNWTKHPTARWQNTAAWDDNFQMTAFTKHDGHVYMYGTQNGRFGNVQLARVPENQVLSKQSYKYWDGRGWSSKQADAVPIAAAPTSELSVQYNAYTNRWLMMYLDEHRAAIVLRSAEHPEGPWSGEQVVARGTDFPALYGTYIHPWSSGPDLYFVMSQWDPYNVFLMRTKLSLTGTPANLASDPGFEEQPSGSVSAPWEVTGRGSIDRDATQAHGGTKSGIARGANGWQELHQNIAVRPNSHYKLTGWLKTNGTEAVLGARTLRGNTLAVRKTGASATYKRFSMDVRTGKDPMIQLYAGVFGSGTDVTLHVDDVTLE